MAFALPSLCALVGGTMFLLSAFVLKTPSWVGLLPIPRVIAIIGLVLSFGILCIGVTSSSSALVVTLNVEAKRSWDLLLIPVALGFVYWTVLADHPQRGK